MPSAFDRFIIDILHHEGGRASAAQEKREGGRTKFGVFEKSHPDVWADGDVTLEEAIAVYRKFYWNEIKGDKLDAFSPGLALSVFDFAVNAGPSRAVKILQQVLNVTPVSGVVANKTLGAIELYADKRKLIEMYNIARELFYAELIRKNPTQYGPNKVGWTNRMRMLRKRLEQL